PGYKAITGLLPHHYASLNKPMVPGRGFDWSAYAVLLGVGLVCAVLALALFERRDLGAPFRLRVQGARVRQRTGGSLALLSSPFARALRDLLGPTLAWTTALGVYVLMIEAMTNEILEPIQAITRTPLGQLLGPLNSSMALLQVMVLTSVVLLLAGFAVTQVATWTADEEAGRFELVLSTPQRRMGLLLARFAAVAVASTGLVAGLGGAFWLGGRLFNVTLDLGKLWAGMVGLVPLILLIVAAGWALAAALRRPAAAVPIVGGVLITMYIFDLLAPLFKPPTWVLQLSIFYHYGRPFLEGISGAGMTTLIVGTGLLLGLALWGFSRRDIVK
ncbi:MAG TPA: hypothetical protein VM536_06935, partial [Chloroflexia bacterium]|nr:hypothetical protein [Chloroflexia bacterium]